MSSTATGTSTSTPGSADDAVLVPERSTTAAAALMTPASSRPTTPSGRWRREVSCGRSRSAGAVPSSERPRSDDPRSLARAATRAEVRQPGTLERAFGGGFGGGGYGPGYGGGYGR